MHEVPCHFDSNPAIYLTLDDHILVELYKRDDEIALSVLIERYKGFVKTKARPFFLIGADREDLVQEGMIGLYKAIRDFNGDKNRSFKSFADLCVTRQIISAVKSASRYKHSLLNNYVSLNRPVFEDESEKILMDLLIKPEQIDPVEQVVRGDEVNEIRNACICTLSKFEKQVLKHYLEGYPYDRIAVFVRRDVKAVDNALQRIKRKVEAYLGKNGHLD